MRRFSLLVALAVSGPPLAAQTFDRSALNGMSERMVEAEKELTLWLNLIKDGSIAASWERTSPRFKRYFLRETWGRHWSGVIGGLQPVTHRKLTAVRYVPIEANRFPEAVIFDTRIEFQGGTFGGETIIVAYENARWQIWDYAVSPTSQFLGRVGGRLHRPIQPGRMEPRQPANENVNRVLPPPKDPPGQP